MAALTLNATDTAVAQAFYTNQDQALKDGISTGTALDRPGLEDFTDDSKTPQDTRVKVEDAFLLPIASLIKAIMPSITGATSVPVWAKSNAPSLTTSSATFADLTGATVSFNQTTGGQKVVVSFDMSSYASVINLSMDIKLVYAGVDQDVFKFFFNTALEHHTQVFSWMVTGPGSTGAKTAKIQWRLASGTGTITLDANDHFSLIAR